MTGRATLAGFIVLFTLAVIPLLSAPIPPLFDYPNHLGRMAILAANGQDPILNRYYGIRWSILPNLGMDAVVPRLATVMPLVEAGRIFLIATLFLLASGPILLSRLWSGNWSPWAFSGFLFLYSRVFLWGFVNYLAGIGLAFWALAGWILLDRAPWLLRGLAGAAAVTIVFFCHLEAFGVLALMLLGVEAPKLVSAARRRDIGDLGARTGAVMLALLPATLLFLVIWQPHAGGAFALPRLERKPDLLFSVFDNYSRPFDIVCFGGLVAAGIAAMALGRFRLAAAARWPLLAIGFVYLALPSTLFTGAGADHRLPLVLFLLLAAGLRPLNLSRRQMTIAMSALTALFVLRMAAIETVWRAAAETYRQDMALLARLPAGARIAVAAPASAVRVSAAPEYHLPVLAILLRQAFVPTLFAFPTQQPVALTPGWDTVAAASDPDRFWRAFAGSDPEALASQHFITDHYDVIAAIGGPLPAISLSGCLLELGTSGTLYLYRVASGLADCRR